MDRPKDTSGFNVLNNNWRENNDRQNTLVTHIVSNPFIPRGAFQTEATQFLLRNPRASMHVDMGLGKSVIVLNAINSLLIAGFRLPVLVIAPLRVARTTWKEECLKWDHLNYLRVSAIVGSPEKRIAALNTESDIYTVNYENLPWLVEQCGDNWPFRIIVADESTRLKNHRSHFKTNKDGTKYLVRTGGSRTNSIARLAFTKTLYFWNLTGTPAPNGLADLWGQQWFIDKGATLGDSYTAFESRWYRQAYTPSSDSNKYKKQFPVMEMLDNADSEIRNAIAPTTFTLRASDYLKLGNEIVNNVFVELPAAVRKLYRDMEKDLYMEIQVGEVEVFTMGARSMKLRQLANGAVYYDKTGSWEALHDTKLEALKSIIEEAAGNPVIVCYHFKPDLERLRKTFPNGKDLGDNKKVEGEFKAGKLPILFIHPASGGHGIDKFQYVTNIIVFFALDWSAENREQVIGRIGAVRQFQAGLDRPVFIHNIVCRDTIDEDILERIESKLSIQEALKAGLARRHFK